ncbi:MULTISPECIES: sensor histidine kinase [unclassified Massilia]|uniref:sensor histidine kinase n=1 Tax=unclassified Massilia TaxID=2609279 RepID=UPI00177DC64D|nr:MULTISPECIES: ATP-binding protein [unclassified Massilia]MBD8532289.1 histidine kinase [Massilia sp. CFBP 13647]MBD8673838.1 histidine kinase [Massilia sp. CFBP 13721]
MTAPDPQHPDPELERLVAERTAALTELVAHLMTCWDDERRLLARKLHDSLGSSMTALTMHLGLLSKGLTDAKTIDRAQQMKTLLNGIIDTNRTVQLSLWNDKLEFLGIKAALAELVAEFGQQHGITARASLPDDDDGYPRAQGVALLRCAEEGLQNALQHGRAATVDVILDDDGEQLMMTVRDDGVGLSQPAPPESLRCHGLRLLRERARALGGDVTLAGVDGGGTALTMILPRNQDN